MTNNTTAQEALRQSAEYLERLPRDNPHTAEARQFAAQNREALRQLERSDNTPMQPVECGPCAEGVPHNSDETPNCLGSLRLEAHNALQLLSQDGALIDVREYPTLEAIQAVCEFAQQALAIARGDVVVVPREPTQAMLYIGSNWHPKRSEEGCRRIYKAMIAAAEGGKDE